MLNSPALYYFGLASVACAVSLVVTPLMRHLAIRLGWVDRPDATRKMQPQAVALGGGAAVMIAAGLTLVVPLWSTGIGLVLKGRWDLIGLFLGTLVIFAVGLWDDIRGMRARHKLLGQIVACLVVISTGLVIDSIQIFGAQIELGLLAWPFTMFWLLGAINALNLIDGADGLATTVGCILCGSIAAMMLVLNSHPYDAAVAMALMGALIGFLAYNFPPASIYLGDAGSMVIGLLTGALAIRGAMKGAATFAIAAPLAVWAVPAFDCAVAIVRRKMTGRKISATDRGHLHHCVLRRGFGSRQMLFFIGGLCLVTALGAVASVAFENELYAAVSVVAVIATLVLARIFGYAELVLAAHTFRDLGTALIMPAWLVARAPRASSVRLQGTRNWERAWRKFIEAAPPLDLHSARLHLNLPWLHESFHASWHADATPGQAGWKLEVPLVIQQRQSGHLLLKGLPAAATWEAQLAKVTEAVDAFVELLEIEALRGDIECAAKETGGATVPAAQVNLGKPSSAGKSPTTDSAQVVSSVRPA